MADPQDAQASTCFPVPATPPTCQVKGKAAIADDELLFVCYRKQ